MPIGKYKNKIRDQSCKNYNINKIIKKSNIKNELNIQIKINSIKMNKYNNKIVKI